LASDRGTDIYRLAVERQLHESDLYWKRNSTFLLVQGVLLGFFGASAKSFGEIQLIPVVAGICLAGLWFLVLRRGKFYVARWEAVVSRLETEAENASNDSDLHLLRYFHEAQASERRHRFALLNAETSQVMKLTTVVVATVWAIAGTLVCLYSPFGQQQGNRAEVEIWRCRPACVVAGSAHKTDVGKPEH
jgi:hypothetical protein